MELLIILEMAQIFVVKYIDNDGEMLYAVQDESGIGTTTRFEIKHCTV